MNYDCLIVETPSGFVTYTTIDKSGDVTAVCDQGLICLMRNGRPIVATRDPVAFVAAERLMTS